MTPKLERLSSDGLSILTVAEVSDAMKPSIVCAGSDATRLKAQVFSYPAEGEAVN